MKSNHWLSGGLIWMMAATVLAQEAKPPATAPKAASAYAKDLVLDPPATATIKNDTLNVRDQPSLTADVVTKLTRGEAATVLEQMTLGKPAANEPAEWSRIALPTNATVWVFADYIDSSTMKATRRLNVRGGPGENFKSLTLLEQGTPVTEIRRAAGWIQILPPTNAFGYVASEYLAIQPAVTPPPVALPPAAPVVAVTEPVAPAPAPAAPVASAPPPVEAAPPPIVAPEPVAAAPVAPEPVSTVTPAPAIAAVPTNVVPPAAPPPQADDEASSRLVTREGYVRKALNIQAPTDYELVDIHSKALTEYLQPKDTKFEAYLGARVAVTGPELLDRRWPKTPILKIQTIEVEAVDLIDR